MSRSDDVPEPPPSDPAADPTGTVRVEDWARRLDPRARRWVRVAGDDRWPWVQFSGVAFDPERPGMVAQDSPWRPHEEVAEFPVAPLLTVAVAFRHTEHGRRRRPPCCTPDDPCEPAYAVRLDGADAEGAAPFKDRG